jgi:hypothetical protein
VNDSCEDLRLQSVDLGLQDSAAVSLASGRDVFNKWKVGICTESIREGVGLQATFSEINLQLLEARALPVAARKQMLETVAVGLQTK